MEIIDTNFINDREIIVRKHEIESIDTLYYYVEVYANDDDKKYIEDIGLEEYLENTRDVLINNELIDYVEIYFNGKEYETHFSDDIDFEENNGRIIYFMDFEDI